MKTLGIIPARGGSKGVKDKNIRFVAGKPLISYSIESARQSTLLNYYLVSTDSEEIARISENYKANVQLRPVNLAEDNSSIVDVIGYVIEQLEQKNEFYDLIVLLQPTSPLKTGEDIDRVITMLEEDKNIDAVISVVPMDEIHPARMYELDSAGKMLPLEIDGEVGRRQDLKPVYYRNGCIYAIRTSIFKQEKSLIIENKKAYIMPQEWLVNIDTEADLLFAELQIARWKKLNS